jgi:tRNA dimethylallyltransferase
MSDPARRELKIPLKNAILIAGPTASGKSALALRIAQENGGSIVNADSMQVYSVLRALSARPEEADLAKAPHHLYGHVDPRQAYSTGAWMRDVEALIDSGSLDAGPAIFVGGTGLYFRALLEGMSEMPVVPDDVRARWRAELDTRGPSALHLLLQQRDPEAAKAIRPSDGQRIVRALEIFEASGVPISQWQKRPGTPLVDKATAKLLVIEPERAVLAQRIAARCHTMMDLGALYEARAIGVLNIEPAMPALKAIGVRELLMADSGEKSLEEAIERSIIATRQYAKRQSTWFRNQFDESWTRIDSSH